MSLLGRIAGAFRSQPEQARGLTIEQVAALLDQGGGGGSTAGTLITRETATQVAAVLACARVIAEGIAQLPVRVYRRIDADTTELAVGHPIDRLLHRKPNGWQTSFEFRELLTWHGALAGNGYAYINRVRGEVRELVPFLPEQVEPVQADDFSMTYRVRRKDDGRLIDEFPARDMVHLRGPGWGGSVGFDIVRLARDVFGLASALEDSQARTHRNGGAPGGILSTEATVEPEVVKMVQESFQKAQSGANRGKTAVLDNGWKFQPMGMTGVDAQHLETRRFQIEEICRVFRVFPAIVMQSDKASTYGSAEQFFLAHVTHTLMPWIERWEQKLDAALLPGEPDLFVKLDMRALLRGDATARSNYYHNGILDGWLTRNEARGQEDFEPLDGLDEPLVPLNMGGAEDTGDPAAPAGADDDDDEPASEG